MNRPFVLNLQPNHVALITECEGVFMIEPMRFLTLADAKNRRKAEHRHRRPA